MTTTGVPDKRGKAWRKIKQTMELPCVVIGYRTGGIELRDLVMATPADGKPAYVGVVELGVRQGAPGAAGATGKNSTKYSCCAVFTGGSLGGAAGVLHGANDVWALLAPASVGHGQKGATRFAEWNRIPFSASRRPTPLVHSSSLSASTRRQASLVGSAARPVSSRRAICTASR